MSLDELGPRICVMGPSNSGKSTLAHAIGRSRGLPVVHLDRLRHLPNTDHEHRPEAEFVALHDEAIAATCWVMDGNYSVCLPKHLERATSFVLLDVPAATSVLRYLRRCWFEPHRLGGLEGGKDRAKWEMVRHIVAVTPANRRRYKQVFDGMVLPKVALMSARELAEFYRSTGLTGLT